MDQQRGKWTPKRRQIRTPADPAYLRDLFSHSARYYDPVNRLTSMGQVVLWRKEVAWAAQVEPGDRVLDAFCGPGGLSEQVLRYLGEGGQLVLADLSPVMLHEARVRLGRQLARKNGRRDKPRPRIDYVAGDLLRDDLELRDFDVVLLGWGLRYVPDVSAALGKMREFLKPGGRIVILEFTRPRGWGWSAPAHFYFRRVLPTIGSWLAADKELHEYMSVSAAEFLEAPVLAGAVRDAGFSVDRCHSHLGGLVTILAAVREGGGSSGRDC
jgi:demethylmenaquinone methyltransferase / 2-methoxy-6-polyprenyl-1,4-benzoquinol methylase